MTDPTTEKTSKTASSKRGIRTRICMISDTHTNAPNPPLSTSNAYRHPLPKSDILLHAGDITRVGRKHEHQQMLSMLARTEAEVKVVIAGNHDITLDEEYYNRVGFLRHRRPGTDFDLYPGEDDGSLKENTDRWREDPQEFKRLYTSPAAKEAKITYLDEGLQTFTLSTGAKFSIYASPYTPEFCKWAFAYEPSEEDRFNPPRVSPSPLLRQDDQQPENPVPDFPGVDIMVTHGPPHGIFDEVYPSKKRVGCENLFKAVTRARPRLHVFGHIHEGYGAGRMNWKNNTLENIRCDPETVLEGRCAYYDASVSESGSGKSESRGSINSGLTPSDELGRLEPKPLVFGEETLFVNASVVTVAYHAMNAPWVVDLDLPSAEDEATLDI